MSDEKNSKQDIQQLQMIEQNLTKILNQKQQFQMQLSELQSAESELKDESVSYKIVGNIMVKSDSKDLREDIKSKKEMIELRIKTIEKQEKNLQEKAKNLKEK